MDKNACGVFRGVVEDHLDLERCEVRGEGRENGGAEDECGSGWVEEFKSVVLVILVSVWRSCLTVAVGRCCSRLWRPSSTGTLGRVESWRSCPWLCSLALVVRLAQFSETCPVLF